MQLSKRETRESDKKKWIYELAFLNSTSSARGKLRFLELTLEKNDEDLGYDKSYECELELASM